MDELTEESDEKLARKLTLALGTLRRVREKVAGIDREHRTTTLATTSA